MDLTSTGVLFVAGCLLGALVVWLLSRARGRSFSAGERMRLEVDYATMRVRIESKDRELSVSQAKTSELEEALNAKAFENTELQKQLAAFEEKLRTENEKAEYFAKLGERFSDAFKALSSDALKSNNQAFLELAKTSLDKFQEGAKGDLEQRQKAINDLVKPLNESLQGVGLKLQELEKARSSAYVSLSEQIKSLASTQTALKDETNNLVKALRAPTTRGRWGEIQLKRVVELAGMLEYCDFVTQQSVATEEGRIQPDLIVRLPNQKNIIVDAKVPLQAYLEALECQSEDQKALKLTEHAKHVRSHLQQLSQKAYWNSISPTPEFVVLFLPGETIFGAALENDPSLIEFGVEQNILIATPTTLIALLRAVAYGWRQERIAENAEAISVLGKALYERLRSVVGHWSDMKKGLERAVESYNKAVGAMESRVLVSARKFKELGAGVGAELELLDSIDRVPRSLEESLPVEEGANAANS